MLVEKIILKKNQVAHKVVVTETKPRRNKETEVAGAVTTSQIKKQNLRIKK